VRSYYLPDIVHLGKVDQGGWLLKPKLPLPNSLVVLSLSYRLRSQSLFDSGYLKILRSRNVELIVYDSEWPIYLLPTDDESINIFIFEVQDTFSEELIPGIFNVSRQ
jgi:hypothetical protein